MIINEICRCLFICQCHCGYSVGIGYGNQFEIQAHCLPLVDNDARTIELLEKQQSSYWYIEWHITMTGISIFLLSNKSFCCMSADLLEQPFFKHRQNDILNATLISMLCSLSLLAECSDAILKS